MAYIPDHFTVWTEIPVSDLDRSMDFYATVTGGTLEKQSMGPNDTAVFKTKDIAQGVGAHLYEGKPAAEGQGPTVHLALHGKLEDGLERTWKAGGKVMSDPIPLGEWGRFAYIQDLDGNSIGLFEAA